MKTEIEILEKHFSYFHEDLDTTIEAMREFAEQFKPKWISVEERLPEEDGIRVLGYSAFQDEAYMCYSNTNGSERRISGPGSVKITHWMPLPTKP